MRLKVLSLATALCCLTASAYAVPLAGSATTAGGRAHIERHGLHSEFRIIGAGVKRPATLDLRHQTDFPRLISIVEALCDDFLFSRAEVTPQLNFSEGIIVVARRVERNFLKAPLFHLSKIGGGLKIARIVCHICYLLILLAFR